MSRFNMKELALLMKEAGDDLRQGYIFGEVEHKEVGKRKQLSGWVSTPSADLADEVVEATSFEKHWQKYLDNSVYCWQHDKNKPIGTVRNPQLSEKGVYLQDVTLTEIPPVELIIWPLIKDGAVKQQSIGFLSLKGRRKGNYYHHEEVYLLESSLVTVACNPEAVIDVVKNYGNYSDIDTLVEDYYSGKLDFDHPARKDFYMSSPSAKSTDSGTSLETPQIKKTEETVNKQIQVIQLSDTIREKCLGGDEIKNPFKVQKDYDEKMSLIHLAKNSNGDYIMPIGTLTQEGFKYSWEKTAIQMCRVLGAKGGCPFDNEERIKAFERLFEAYSQLEKELPTTTSEENEQVSIALMREDLLNTLWFSKGNITFNEGEDIVFSRAVLTNNLEDISNTLKNFNSRNILEKDMTNTIVKYAMAWFELMIGVYDQEDADAINRVLQALLANQEEEDDVPSAYNAEAPEAQTSELTDNIKEFLVELRKFKEANSSE